ncbi:hypothetical protein EJB05_37424, partial [Eragrostis curvula]
MTAPPSSPTFAQALPSRTIPLVILSFLVAVLYLVAFPNNNLKLQEVFASSCSNDATASTSRQLAKQPVDLRVFLGIITRPDFYERRAHLRLAYSLQPRPVRAVVDVRFVFCNLDKEEDRVLVAMEIIVHADIVVLNCTENMNDGKTYEYFSTIPRMFADEPYDYVGKTDDDAYYRLAALADTLRNKPRDNLYHGMLIPCHVSREWQYMAGFGYIVSWDIAEWISATEELRNDRGHEDMVFGQWVRKAGKFKNVYGEEPRMYDYWDRESTGEDVTCFRHELIADTVGVHKVKTQLKWARMLNFFNATQGLKPSKMYDVDRLKSNLYHV